MLFEGFGVFCQVMGVVGPSSVADGLPLLHLSPYLSPPLPFSTAVVRLVALQIQVDHSSSDTPLLSAAATGTNAYWNHMCSS